MKLLQNGVVGRNLALSRTGTNGPPPAASCLSLRANGALPDAAAIVRRAPVPVATFRSTFAAGPEASVGRECRCTTRLFKNVPEGSILNVCCTAHVHGRDA
jgi:hypothetical protein